MEIRVNDNSVEISAYINAVERDSKPLRDPQGYFIERVQAGCFERALQRNDNVGLMLNHSKMISDTKHGVSLVEDSIGLLCRATITDDDVVQAAKDGTLNECSFGFAVIDDEWSIQDGVRHRLLRDLYLYEVSLLTVEGAYRATAVHCRGADNTLKEYRYNDNPDEQAEQAEPVDEPTPDPVSDNDGETIETETVERNYDAYKALVYTYI